MNSVKFLLFINMTIAVLTVTAVGYSSEVLYSGGSGTADDPYLIATAEQLNNVRYNMDAHFMQTADIDLSGYTDGTGWQPIGYYVSSANWMAFTGFYDGNGYQIANLFIHRPTENFVGLWGYVISATIKNIHLTDVQVTGKSLVGGLSGFIWYSSIENCFVSGAVEGNSSVGGLVGECEYGTTVMNCHTDCVIAGDSYAGGLVGFSWAGSVFINSSASASVTGKWFLGGFAGYIFNSRIENCYAMGMVTGDDYIGGLVGDHVHDSIIENCYAKVAVKGNCCIGGMAGSNRTSSITGSYASGTVTGNEFPGGLVGYNDEGMITDSYYDSNTSGQSDTDKGLPRTTDEMLQQATFEEWDFVDIWATNEGISYPFFQWQIGLPPLAQFTSVITAGSAPFKVPFVDLSTGLIDSREWSFGDGNTSSLLHPEHTYENAGTYTVSLTITGPAGEDTISKTEYINVTTRTFSRFWELYW